MTRWSPTRRTLGWGLVLVLLAGPMAAEAEGRTESWAVVAEAKPSNADARKREPQPTASTNAPSQGAVYRPPRRGNARTRIGGGTRSLSKTPHVQVLAPDHVGLTTRAQPRLGWFLSAATDQRIDFTLTRPDAIDPILETTLPAPTKAGVQFVSLQDLGIALEPGAPYEWSIAVVVDPEERDQDVFASGAIERDAATAALTADVAEMASHRAFALHGFWYDAIADLSRSIDEADSSALSLERAALLEQVDLAEVARFERARIAAR